MLRISIPIWWKRKKKKIKTDYQICQSHGFSLLFIGLKPNIMLVAFGETDLPSKAGLAKEAFTENKAFKHLTLF